MNNSGKLNTWQSDSTRVPITVPPDNIHSESEQLLRPQFKAVQRSVFDFKSLANQPDYLLPKLLSGEVEVAELEELCEI
jgi:type I restriction enzyme, S subunit